MPAIACLDCREDRHTECRVPTCPCAGHSHTWERGQPPAGWRPQSMLEAARERDRGRWRLWSLVCWVVGAGLVFMGCAGMYQGLNNVDNGGPGAPGWSAPAVMFGLALLVTALVLGLSSRAPKESRRS